MSRLRLRNVALQVISYNKNYMHLRDKQQIENIG